MHCKKGTAEAGFTFCDTYGNNNCIFKEKGLSSVFNGQDRTEQEAVSCQLVQKKALSKRRL